MPDSIQAWHFVGKTLRDGRPVPPDGEWLVHDGPVEIRKSGLHASRRIIDALVPALGVTICRVSCREVVAEQDNELVCRQRRIDWRVDGEEILHAFIRKVALSVIDLWDAPEVVRKYLETGDETLLDDAWVAAKAAAMFDGKDVAQIAAWAATRGAYGGVIATVIAVSSIQISASAAGDAKIAELNAILEKMVMEAHDA